jgi:hypothetical protein
VKLIYRSPEYLAYIRRQPCAACHLPANFTDPHHEPLGETYMGGKPHDTHAIPLCRSCHNIRHEEGPEWLEKILDVKKLIIRLLTRYLLEKTNESGRLHNRP